MKVLSQMHRETSAIQPKRTGFRQTARRDGEESKRENENANTNGKTINAQAPIRA